MNLIGKIKGLFSKEQQFGFVPNPEQDADPRNLYYEDLAPLGGAEPPPEYGDIEKGDWTLAQGATSSCVCHASVYAFNQANGRLLSPRYAFNKVKKDPKYPSSQLHWGSYTVDSLKLKVNEGVAEYGAVDPAHTTSDEDYLSLALTGTMESSAARNKGGSYIFVSKHADSLGKFDDVVRFMHEQKKPVLVGVAWRGSYSAARSTGIIPAVPPSGSSFGHLMLAVAWKRINGHEYIGLRNSFGASWGDRGRVWMPKGFIQISGLNAYLPPSDTVALEIETPTTKPAERNILLEKLKAQELRQMLEKFFPLEVQEGARKANFEARSLAGRQWLLIVPAVTYRGYTVVDIKNYIYSRSRGKKDSKAYSFDLTKPKV